MRSRLLEEAEARLLQGDLARADALVDRLLETSSDDADALHIRGLIAAQAGELGRATELLQSAVALRPTDKSMLRNFAALLLARGDLSRCGDVLSSAKDAGADVADLLEQLGNQARANRQSWAVSEMMRGYQAHVGGDLNNALLHFRTGLAAGADDRLLHSAYLCTLLHDPEQTAHTLEVEHQRWARLHLDKTSTAPVFANTRDPGRRVRVGYLCGDLRGGPLVSFLPPVVSSHDRTSVQVFGYDASGEPDGCASRFRSACDHSRDITGLDGRQVADVIRHDEIDVLLDAGGHLFSDTLTVHSHRPAPVSASFPHYPFSNFVHGIDYLLTDDRLSPPGSEHEYSERLVRLPESFITYEPAVDFQVTELPASRNGFITFGVFQRPLKYNAGTWDAWGAVLRANPTAKLVIRCGDDQVNESESELRKRLLGELELRRVAAERVLLQGRFPLAAHFEELGKVDIALDTFPYNGQTTTCDCLWMGVPVVTMRGDAHFARVGASLLHSVGLSHLVVANLDGYVGAATRLASDLDSLRSLRAGLRSRMRSTSLGDPKKHTRAIEQAYRSMWRDWCSKS